MDGTFYLLSKLAWAILAPGSWLIVGLALTLVGTLRRRRRLALWSCSVTLALALVLAMLPVGHLLLRPLEGRYPSAPALGEVTGILVLGGAELPGQAARSGRVEFNEAGERITESMALARRYPDARVVFTGGSGAVRDLGRQDGASAVVAEQFFIAQGLDAARLTLESRSRNTVENARLSYDLVQPVAGETWVLVTSAFHMPRAMKSFARAGWPELVAWPVDHRAAPFAADVGWDLAGNLLALDVAIREYVGMFVYDLTGR